uniref:Uncharacterized protein n=1 Tax=Myoviridae sp. ctZgq1 TaxID=2826666 RepID=A0A8S5LXP5_9CAUD|nr:MAG TPA: hypothetical protein [Myoviridae sp. ctZgq1]
MKYILKKSIIYVSILCVIKTQQSHLSTLNHLTRQSL